MTQRADRIRILLERHFAPTALEVRNDSALHAGHAGMQDAEAQAPPGQAGGETHFSVTMVSPAFQGRSRVQRSRAVHEVLAVEFAAGLHALALALRAPEEQQIAPPGAV